jgi:hypothetical protein
MPKLTHLETRSFTGGIVYSRYATADGA